MYCLLTPGETRSVTAYRSFFNILSRGCFILIRTDLNCEIENWKHPEINVDIKVPNPNYCSRAVTSNKSTIFFPIFPWILQCAVIGYGVIVLMYLLSIGDSAFKTINLKDDASCNCRGVYTEVSITVTIFNQ